MATSALKVYRNRTNVVPFDLGVDITGDTIVAEIRTGKDPDSPLVATWTVAVTTAATGIGTLTLDDSDAAGTKTVGETDVEIVHGYMDILRVTGGEPVSMFDAPLPVRFIDMPTAVPA